MSFCAQGDMSLLAELGGLFLAWLYKHGAPPALGPLREKFGMRASAANDADLI